LKQTEFGGSEDAGMRIKATNNLSLNNKGVKNE
jgi:hypothetical protein